MAQQQRADLHAAIELRYPDNTSEDITPARLRAGLHELVDSVFVTASDTPGIPIIPEYNPATAYAIGNLVRYTPTGGQEAFYRALTVGKHSAPGPGNLVDWKVVPGPVKATDLAQSISLIQAQGLDGAGVVAGRKYQIDCGLNAAGKQQYLYLDGLEEYFDTSRGTLEVDGKRTAVEYIDLGAGSWQVSDTAPLRGAELTAARQTYAGLTPRAALIKLLNETPTGTGGSPSLTPGMAQGSDSVTFLSAVAS